MKRNLFIGLTLAFAVFAFLTTTSLTGQAATDSDSPSEVATMPACPFSPTTIQGCVIDINGCLYVNTINGRQIAVGLVGYPVGAGDEIQMTGNWQTDADCAPCVLNAFSVTDIGDC